MVMHLVYIDDSGDESFCVFSAIVIPVSEYNHAFAQIRQFRKELKQSDGMYVYKELHATEFVSGHGKVGNATVGKSRRCQIFKEALQLVASLPGLQLFNTVFPKKDDERAFEWLMNRINACMKACDSYAIIICDEGKETSYTKLVRRMRVHNHIPSRFGGWDAARTATKNIPIERIIEDPIFKKSEHSYFIQLADFCAYALLRREHPTTRTVRYGLDTAFDLLKPVLALKANARDPEGIIRPAKSTTVPVEFTPVKKGA
jgi:hypothetical protein